METKDWLLTKDEYIPENDKDSFIDRNILEIIKILSRIKRIKIYENGLLFKINPLIKLIFSIVLIVFLSMSVSKLYIYTVGTYILLCLSTLDGCTLKDILSVSFIVPIFTLIILIPSMIKKNLYNSFILILKVSLTVININLLSYTTKWDNLAKSLKVFFIPDIFILIFHITIKYIFILSEISLEMLYSLKLRSVGRNDKKSSSISNIMGNLFLKSKIMGEEMYSAMECRGFTGEYKSYSKFKFTPVDFLYTILNILIIILFFILRR